jgi:hypothetical protein
MRGISDINDMNEMSVMKISVMEMPVMEGEKIGPDRFDNDQRSDNGGDRADI